MLISLETDVSVYMKNENQQKTPGFDCAVSKCILCCYSDMVFVSKLILFLHLPCYYENSLYDDHQSTRIYCKCDNGYT